MTMFATAPSLRALPAALLVGLLGACTSTPPTPSASSTTVPAALVPTATEREAFTWHAIGSQIYECKAAEKGTWAWVFVAPEADLYNQKDEKVGNHGAGPHWTALDGSRATGVVKARSNGARPQDIPLLLLSTQSSGTDGVMARVSSVQRLNTEGGMPPKLGCATATDAGKRIKEGYSADYVFFKTP